MHSRLTPNKLDAFLDKRLGRQELFGRQSGSLNWYFCFKFNLSTGLQQKWWNSFQLTGLQVVEWVPRLDPSGSRIISKVGIGIRAT